MHEGTHRVCLLHRRRRRTAAGACRIRIRRLPAGGGETVEHRMIRSEDGGEGSGEAGWGCCGEAEGLAAVGGGREGGEDAGHGRAEAVV